MIGIFGLMIGGLGLGTIIGVIIGKWKTKK